jgi:hypothetical protein
MQPSCPGSGDLNWTGKGLIYLTIVLDYPPPPQTNKCICSKSCPKRNLTGPENFSAKACFHLIEVHCLKRYLKGPEHFSAKARLNWTEEKKNRILFFIFSSNQAGFSARSLHSLLPDFPQTL